MELQIYFFSSIFLINLGIRLSYDKFGELLKINKILKEGFIKHKVLNVIVAIGSLVLGIVQLFYTEGEGTFLIGDFLPAVLGIVGGVFYLLFITKKEYEGEKKFILLVQKFLHTNIAIIGLIMILIGMFHAVFPKTLLL